MKQVQRLVLQHRSDRHAGLVLFSTGGMSPRWVLRMHRARALAPREAPGLYRIVTELARRANLPSVPSLYLMPAPVMNAFAVGNARDSAIGLTGSLLRRLQVASQAGQHAGGVDPGALATGLGNIEGGDVFDHRHRVVQEVPMTSFTVFHVEVVVQLEHRHQLLGGQYQAQEMFYPSMDAPRE